MAQTDSGNAGSFRSGRLMLLVLAAAFLLPIGLSVGLYASSWRPARLANHGDLVQPPRQVGDAGLLTADGRALRFDTFHGKWTLVSFGADCPAACRQALYRMRQVHVALGKEMGRVQRVFVATGGLGVGSARDPEVTVISGPPAATDALARRFGGGLDDGRVYLVDPLGNLILVYPPDSDPGGMRRDLVRLLQYSWVG
jgi:cytochrome oxidase Cu insertion factor (SCO1/SenC/PrrC family)